MKFVEILTSKGDSAIINLAAVMKIVPLGKGGCRIYFSNREENVGSASRLGRSAVCGAKFCRCGPERGPGSIESAG
jgi:hypothetical protein